MGHFTWFWGWMLLGYNLDVRGVTIKDSLIFILVYIIYGNFTYMKQGTPIHTAMDKKIGRPDLDT